MPSPDEAGRASSPGRATARPDPEPIASSSPGFNGAPDRSRDRSDGSSVGAVDPGDSDVRGTLDGGALHGSTLHGAGADDLADDLEGDLETDDVGDEQRGAAEGPGAGDVETEEDGPAPPPRRRLWILAVLAAALVILLLAAILAERRGGEAVQPVLPLDVWAPYWALDESAPEIGARVGSLRQVSPFWFRATGATTIEADPNASDELTGEFLDGARSAALVPSIVDATEPGRMAAILADPVTRRQHVEAIVAFAEDGGYDGVDIDYERFAFSDGRDTWEATRPAWVAFVTELGAALHADGRILTVSVPPVYDAGRTPASGYWVYDYGGIADHVDAIRIMAYDYSVPTPGPIAPLAFVQQAIDGALAATDRPEKLVLGVPAYGRNWPVSVEGTCPEGQEVPGTTSVTVRGVDELVARRGAAPVYDPVAGEWSFEYPLEISDGTTTCVQTRRVHYVDAAGIRQRVDLARAAGLGGTALWALGFEDDAVWDALLAADAPDPAGTTVG